VGTAPDRGPPSAVRVALAILPLPFVATVVVPALCLALSDSGWDLEGAARAITFVAGAVLVFAGLLLFVTTVRLFASVGHGTLAPWDPPERLVVRGPYRRLRHPMITGVAFVLAGEALVFESTAIAIVLAVFVAANAVYLPLVEEPRLIARFGSDYERYQHHVPRWLPRRRGWDPPGE
jgi:protein-S-isoprenylcysteine O-methyltransferase Ste14